MREANAALHRQSAIDKVNVKSTLVKRYKTHRR